MRVIKRFLSIFVVLTLLSSNIFAGDLEDITKTMQEKVDSILSILKDPKLLKCEKNVKLSKQSEGMFDYTLMSRLSVGKKNWQKFTKEQRKEFVALFSLRMKQSYIQKAQLLSDEKVTVYKAIQIKPTRIHLSVVIQGKDKDTDIMYKYYKAKNNKWLIYDVEIAKISILQTYRAQFAEKLSSSSVAELLQELKKTTDKK